MLTAFASIALCLIARTKYNDNIIVHAFPFHNGPNLIRTKWHRNGILIDSHPEFAFMTRSKSSNCLQMSYVGDNNMGNGNGGNGNNKNGNNPMDDWLPDPSNNEPESESARETRKQRADARLPINFKKNNADIDGDDDGTTNEFEEGNSSALRRSSSSSALDKLTTNPYLQVVSSLSPSEIISRFTLTAHPRVQEAAKTTILGLIGSLPKMAFETKVLTTGAKLANLMFQLQMTGYMFKNAEYRMALSREFGGKNERTEGFLLKSSTSTDDSNGVREDILEDDDEIKSIKGKIKVNYSPDSSSDNAENNPFQVEVDASAFTSELREEVSRLKEELSSIRSSKEEAIRKDLLTYIRTLPPLEIQKLTNTMSDDVLSAMKGLVGAVMAGIDADTSIDGESDEKSKEGLSPDTVMEQSGEAMAQLCMWQLVVGYNLRELEVREEMKVSLLENVNDSNNTNGNNGLDDESDFSPGLQSGGME